MPDEVDDLTHTSILAALKTLRRRGDFGAGAIAERAEGLCRFVEGAGLAADRNSAAVAHTLIVELAAEVRPQVAREIFAFVCLADPAAGSLTRRREDAKREFNRSDSVIRRYEDRALEQIALGLQRHGEETSKAAAAHRLVIVTAHNGTGLRECLGKFGRYLARRAGKRPAFVSLDDAFVRHALEHLDGRPQLDGRDQRPLARQVPEVYRLNQRALRRAWTAALQEAAGKVEALLAQQDVILSFSASLYHHESRSIFCPIDVAAM
jgi:hypothetical protein